MLTKPLDPLLLRRGPPWQHLRTRLLTRALATAAKRVTQYSPRRARTHLDLLARLSPPILGVSREQAVVGGVSGEWFYPRGWRGGINVLHLHGGGYALCSSITHRMMISELCRASMARGFGADYRLAPEHPFPAAIDDCEAVYEGLLHQGVDPERLVISGDSAGGALVIATMVRLRNRGLPLPAAGVLMSPWVDLTCKGKTVEAHASSDYLGVEFMQAYAGLYLGQESATNHFASPIHADLSGLPPLLIQAGGAEMLLADIVDFKDRAEAAGLDVTLQVWEEMVHAFQGFTLFLPEARQAIEAAGAYIRDRTGERVGQGQMRRGAKMLPPPLSTLSTASRRLPTPPTNS
jgi:monoterpene epsilon-lactone hydrolase